VITALGAEGSISNSDLQGIGTNLGGNYTLGANIDASATSAWNGGEGFEPLGRWSSRFTGRLDGLGHSVDQLSIDRAGLSYTGLIGVSQGATIANIGIMGGNVNGKRDLGSLVGWSVATTISNSYNTAAVVGRSDSLYIGGLVGMASGSRISSSYATGAATGHVAVGGLVGKVQKIVHLLTPMLAARHRVTMLAVWSALMKTVASAAAMVAVL
jgi:hypothetical protein